MITFQPVDFLKGIRVARTQAREKRFFLIRRVALSASTKVSQRRFHRIALFAGKTSSLSTIDHHTEDAQETLDPPVAVFEHPNGVIESAIGLCTNLNRHCLSFLLPSIPLNVVEPAKIVTVKHSEEHGGLLLFPSAVRDARGLSE
jgi:hypothetical protein